MQFVDYQTAAVLTMNETVDSVYLASKLMIESAEAAQPVIKRWYHNSNLSIAGVAEELGDVLWYVAALAHAYNLNLDDIAQANLDKLAARHGKAYNPAHYEE